MPDPGPTSTVVMSLVVMLVLFCIFGLPFVVLRFRDWKSRRSRRGSRSNRIDLGGE